MYLHKELETMTRPEIEKLQLERLKKTVNHCMNSPFYKKRFEENNLKPEDIQTLDDLRKIPFTTKQDLRDTYPFGIASVPLEKATRLHSSSGTTGNPICIPNPMNDIEVWRNGAMRCLAMYGIRAGDVLQVSYGYGLFTGGLGLHYGGEGLGCSVLPTSGGNTERQVMLMRDLGVNAIACTPSYFLRIIDEAKRQGVDFRKDTNLKHGIFGAEPWTAEMRRKIEDETGIVAHDIYGLTEIAGPGVAGSCGCCDGLHIWEDHFYPEIIDPETLEPVPDGEQGELVFTTISRCGTPMIRYRTRDLTRLRTEQCACGRTMRVMERISARSDDMLIIHGVNVFPGQIEAGLLRVPEVAPHYQIVLSSTDTLDLFEIKVEVSAEAFSDNIRHLENLRRRVLEAVKSIIGLTPKIILVGPGTLPRSEGKIRRVIDNRNK